MGVGDGHLDIDSGLDGDARDLLEHVRRAVHVDQALVDTHLNTAPLLGLSRRQLVNPLSAKSTYLVVVPGLGTLTARGLAGGDAKDFGRHAHWALDLQVLVLCALDQLLAD